MKKLVFLLLLASAFATCQDMAFEAEQWTTVGYSENKACSDPSWYVNFSKKAEAYNAVALCFEEAEEINKKVIYHKLSADNYKSAAANLCLIGDVEKKARLSLASGENYNLAGYTELSLVQYEEASDLYNKYPTKVNRQIYVDANAEINKIQNPIPSTHEDIEPDRSIDLFPYAFGVVILLAIVFFIIQLRR